MSATGMLTVKSKFAGIVTVLSCLILLFSVASCAQGNDREMPNEAGDLIDQGISDNDVDIGNDIIDTELDTAEAIGEPTRQNIDTGGVRMGGEIFYDGMIPSDWPDDIPLMDGVHIMWGRSGGEGDGNQWLKVSTVGYISLEEFPRFYLNLPGWDIDESEPVIRDDDEVRMQLIRGNARLELTQFPYSDHQDRGDTIMHLTYHPG